MSDDPAPAGDPFADDPDHWDEADRSWEEKWTDDPVEEEPPLDPPPATYQGRTATPGRIHDAYGEGMRGAGPYLGLGAQIGGSMLFFVVAGLLVDRWLGTSPWGILVGAVLGMVGVFALVVRIANEANKK